MPRTLPLPSFDDLLASVGQVRGPKRISWTPPPTVEPLCVPKRPPRTPPTFTPGSTPSSTIDIPPLELPSGPAKHPSIGSADRCERYQDRVKLLRKQSSQSLDCDIAMPSVCSPFAPLLRQIGRPQHFRSHSHPSTLPLPRQPAQTGFHYACTLPPAAPLSKNSSHPQHHSPLAIPQSSRLDSRSAPGLPRLPVPPIRPALGHRKSDSIVSSSSVRAPDPYDGRYDAPWGGLGPKGTEEGPMRIPRLPRF